MQNKIKMPVSKTKAKSTSVKLKEAPQKKPVKGFMKKLTRGASK